MLQDPKFKGEKVSAGRILVVGSQGGGKSALATKLASMTDQSIEYRDEFAGTVETEYLKVSFDNGNFFGLLLPIGGQEKWSYLRKAFGETAEGLITIIDSCCKTFWPSSFKQAYQLASQIPYEDYPICIFVTKQDLNEGIRANIDGFAKVIAEGFQKAKAEGLDFYARGFKIIKRHVDVPEDKIPFCKAEQIIANALEHEYFTNVDYSNPGVAKKKIDGFSLVNCRLFSRALATALSQGGGQDRDSVLSLLNDMRPTLLELDSTWEALRRKYPNAGDEPWVSHTVTEKEIKDAMLKQLLATDEDIAAFAQQMEKMHDETGWKLEGALHTSIFSKKGLQEIANLVHQVMLKIAESKKAEKFLILDPLEPLF